MYINNKILIGKSENKDLFILLDKANRHGLITGASGSGKTTTLKVIAESFSDAGVPVFISDVKGDLSSTALCGEFKEEINNRLQKLNISENEFQYKDYPVRFWDIYGKNGHPIKTTIKNIGPSILSIMLGLSEAQEGVLNIAFKIAEDEGLNLDDLKDLRKLLQYVGDNNKNYTTKYGNITTQSIGVIQRSLLGLEQLGADNFFSQPALDINDFIAFDNNGRGIVNILHAVELFQSTDLYTSLLLWLLTNLFHTMPEVGDLDKPKIIFFFDEAHLLFDGMPEYRLKRISQIVKLIRSKGIGLYFISQGPTDIPDEILAQLGNRIQHTLRAYTPAEQKVIKAAADSFRTNPNFNTVDAIMSLGTGEALISFQNENGEPEVVEKATILPPQSKMGTIDPMTRNKIINNSILCGKYDETIDNESAYEIINKKYEEEENQKKAELEKLAEEKKAKEEEKQRIAKEKAEEKARKEAERAKKNSVGYKFGKKVVNKTTDKVINKGLNSLFKNLFK